jgi:hypothetical protein
MLVSAPAARPRTAIHLRRERLFFTGMAVACLVAVFAGFARTYYLRPYFGTPAPAPLLHVHGFVFTSWILLLVVQTTLVAANRTRLHRQLGVAGAVVAALMVILGTLTAIVRARVAELPADGPPALAFLTIPLGDMVVFATLVSAAFYFRRHPDMHKRLMLLATIAILPAATARWPLAFIQQVGPLAFFGLADLFIVPLLAYDGVTRGRPHRVTVVGALFLVASHPLRLMIGPTAAWLACARWLTQWT